LSVLERSYRLPPKQTQWLAAKWTALALQAVK
jgi:hypothetical protein